MPHAPQRSFDEQRLDHHLTPCERLIKADVGDADRLLIAQRTVVAEDWHLVEGVAACAVERAVAVVIADSIRGRKQSDYAV
jgi:hypothetical protein